MVWAVVAGGVVAAVGVALVAGGTVVAGAVVAGVVVGVADTGVGVDCCVTIEAAGGAANALVESGAVMTLSAWAASWRCARRYRTSPGCGRTRPCSSATRWIR